MKLLANDFTVVQDTTNESLFSFSPGICMGKNNRIIVTSGASGNNDIMESYEIKGKRYGGYSQGRVYLSDDEGHSFKKVHEFPFMHMRPFTTGDRIYILGQCNDLMIIYSDDNGETWSNPYKLTNNQDWHQAPCNVLYYGDNIYLVMERRVTNDVSGWSVNNIAPVLMKGNINKDLSIKENWTFASELPFFKVINNQNLDYFGIPFYFSPLKTHCEVAPKRYNSNIGWLESNVVKIYDKKHYLYDESSFYLLTRAHTGLTNYGCLLKVKENSDGTMTTSTVKVPSGKQLIYVPIPGGQMKFHIIYDELTNLYWLLSTQARDSFTKVELLTDERYNLPDNERNKLVLHFSTNCFDWCFAGIVAKGEKEIMARHYAAMIINKDDLYIVSRSGNEYAQSAHNGNMITFHKVLNFRKLVY